jgi:NADPH:quinone reductase
MRALIYDPAAPQRIRLGEVPEPVPAESQVLIKVSAASLNFVDLAYLAERKQPGDVPGVDAAGVVVRAAEGGSGPPVGTRVAGFGPGGAWAELRAVDTADVAVLPDSIDFGAGCAVPAAGVTALQAMRRLGSVLGKKVLVTGASGGVGRFAVQLAARAGAHVIASVGKPARGDGLIDLGAAEVIVGTDGLREPVYGVLDNVGGDLLAEAFRLVEPGGLALAIGKASRRPTTIDFEQERLNGGGKGLEVFVIATPLSHDLSHLLELLERGELDPQIGWRASWQQAADAAAALLERRVAGKAVLDIADCLSTVEGSEPGLTEG